MNRLLLCTSSQRPSPSISFRSWLGALGVVVFICHGAMAQKDTGGLAAAEGCLSRHGVHEQ